MKKIVKTFLFHTLFLLVIVLAFPSILLWWIGGVTSGGVAWGTRWCSVGCLVNHYLNSYLVIWEEMFGAIPNHEGHDRDNETEDEDG